MSNVYNELHNRIQHLDDKLQFITQKLIDATEDIKALKNFRSCYDPTFSPFNAVPKDKK